jgi:uncharacterized protein involved in response to NO
MAQTPSITAAPPAVGRLALLAYGFRPFFLLAAFYAAFAIPVWLILMIDAGALPTALAPMQWHAHEMIFGFVLAGIMGFYLTAVPNWTGAPPLRGAALGILVALWLAARAAMWLSGVLPAGAVALLAIAPPLGLAVFVLPTLARARQRRNLMFLVIPLALAGAILLVHLEPLGWTDDSARTGLQLGIDLALLLITVIGGRIVPTFTANALKARGDGVLPRSVGWLDRLAILSVAALLVADLTEHALGIGIAALAAAVLNALRLAGWRPLRTLGTPLLWVLHLGYGWLVAGFALKAVAALTDALPASAALHALTIGAVGTMMLAVMSRAALGHTGRPLVAQPATVAAYGLVSLAALLRIAAAVSPEWYLPLVQAAGVLWSLGFALFLWDYAPILLRPRIDGKPG